MKKIKSLTITVILCCQISGFGQVTSPSKADNNNDSQYTFKGWFYIDSIFDMGTAYLITVISADSLETTSPNLSIFTSVGTPFTIISFKNEMKKDNTISKGEMYKFTLSPPDDIWTLYGGKMDDWSFFQTVCNPEGSIIKVPLPRIKTQLMRSLELIDLQYIVK